MNSRTFLHPFAPPVPGARPQGWPMCLTAVARATQALAWSLAWPMCLTAVARATQALAWSVCLAAVCVLCVSCQHRDFCYDHEEHTYKTQAAVRADYILRWETPEPQGTDWAAHWLEDLPMAYADLVPALPEGLRVTVFADTEEPLVHNLPPQGGVVWLPEGQMDLLFYNNDTETFRYSGTSSSDAFYATTRTRQRSTYHVPTFYDSPSGAEEPTLTAPDHLFGAAVRDYDCHRTQDPEPLEVTLQPLVHTYVVVARVKAGGQYIARARGAMAGMAAGVWVAQGRNTDERATMLFDCQLTPTAIVATVNTFGTPGYPYTNYTRTAGAYALTLEVGLTSGKIVHFDFDITRQVASQPRGGVIEVEGIEIDPDQPSDTEVSGGFDVDVNTWGEYEDILI